MPVGYLQSSSSCDSVSRKDFATTSKGSEEVRSTPATLSSETGSILPPSDRNCLYFSTAGAPSLSIFSAMHTAEIMPVEYL